MSTFKQVKNAFNKLSEDKKEKLLQDIYDFSKDMKIFLESRLLENTDSGKEFVNQMQKETLDKVFKRKGEPGTPDGRKVNSIISKAKKSKVDIEIIIELEKLAFEGFVEFLNEFGGGPENFDEMAANHLEEYLKLVKYHFENENEQIKIFEEMRNYLLKKDNMYTDYVYEVFEEETGIKLGRY